MSNLFAVVADGASDDVLIKKVPESALQNAKLNEWLQSTGFGEQPYLLIYADYEEDVEILLREQFPSIQQFVGVFKKPI
jgi:hypothetical protein